MDPRKLWRRYVLALAAIACLSGSVFMAATLAAPVEKSHAAAINISGRQRMLSQRIALYATLAAEPRTTAERSRLLAALEAATTLFETSHVALTQGDPELGLSAHLPRGVHALYFDSPGVDELSRRYVEHARRAAMLGPDASEHVGALTLMAGDELLRALDRVVSAYETAARAQSDRIFLVELFAFLAALAVIGVEALFIFWPAHKTIDRAFGKLEESNRLLGQERDAARAQAEALRDALARERTLQTSLDGEKAANAAKAHFIACMSHELRTPLNGVLGMARALKTTKLENRQREMADIIEDSGEGLLAVLNDILDFSKSSGGAMKLERAPVLIDDVAGAVGRLFAPLAKEKGLSLDVRIAMDPGRPFLGDALRLRQIVGNLVSNAIKFTAEGGVTVTAAASDGTLTFVVKDSGIGLDPADKDRLFRPFEQADMSTTRRFGGTGLGLAIARQLCEAMGGSIDVDSAPGRGATFIVALPLEWADVARASGRPKARTAVAATSGEEKSLIRILVVDDNHFNRRVMKLLLAPFGVRVEVAENGRKAVDACAQGGFDLVLLDIHMPEMDGIAAAHEIRRQEATLGRKPVPIIAVTADVRESQIAKCRESGIDDVCPKPVEANVIDRFVRIAKRGRRAA